MINNEKMRTIPGFPLIIAMLYVTHLTAQSTISDNFDSKELSSIWSDWRFLPGAVEFQSAVVKSGSGAVKLTLNPGDQMPEEKETILERAELSEARHLVSIEDSTYRYSFSLFLPADFPILPSRLIIAQWKQFCETKKCLVDNPVIALRFENGEFAIESKTSPTKLVLFETKDDIRNRWLNFRFQVRFSRTARGHIHAWLNEQKIISFEGATAYSSTYGYAAPGYFYFKMGLYRDHVNVPMTIYIDEYRKQQLSGILR